MASACCANGGNAGSRLRSAGEDGMSPHGHAYSQPAHLIGASNLNTTPATSSSLHSWISTTPASTPGSGGSGQGGSAGRTGTQDGAAQGTWRAATAGGWGQGGHGGAGRVGGGGGGAGLVGGGGGGGGLQGSGGGGGSSFVAVNRDRAELAGSAPRLSVHAVANSPSSALVSWSHGPGAGDGATQLHQFVVEGALGFTSEEWLELCVVRFGSHHCVWHGLAPGQQARVRVRAVGHGEKPSSEWAYALISMPSVRRQPSRWQPMFPLLEVSERGGAVGASVAPPPSSGASITEVCDGFIMFGGLSAGESCDRTLSAACNLGSQVSNDLWKLDPVLNTWQALAVVGGIKPSARHRHAASNLQGQLCVFGGAATPFSALHGGGVPSFLSDTWCLDQGHTQQRQGTAVAFSPTPGIGAQQMSSVMEIEGQGPAAVAEVEEALARAANSSLSHAEQGLASAALLRGLDLECTADIKVVVQLQVSCPVTLSILLFGPSRRPHSSAVLGPRKHPQPSARGIQLLRGSFPACETGATKYRNVTISFSDDATDLASIPQSASGQQCQHVNASGGVPACPAADVHQHMSVLKPVEPLSSLLGAPSASNWTLQVTSANLSTIRVTSWTLQLRTRPCTRQARWFKVHTPMTPPARMDATAVVVHGEWFVHGGSAGTPLQDMWRYSPQLLDWVQLRQASPPHRLRFPSPNMRSTALGRAAVLSPWGVLTFGGRPGAARGHSANQVWQYCPRHKVWSVASSTASDTGETLTETGTGPHQRTIGADMEPTSTLLPQHARSSASRTAEYPQPDVQRAPVGRASQGEAPVFARPARRAFASLALVGVSETPPRFKLKRSPALLVAGGLGEGGLMSDLWTFDLAGVAVHTMQGHAEHGRLWQAAPGDTVEQRPELLTLHISGAPSLGTRSSPGDAGCERGVRRGWSALQGEEFVHLRHWWQRQCSWRLTGNVTSPATSLGWESQQSGSVRELGPCFSTAAGEEASESTCTLDDLLLAALCEGRFQSIGAL